jgi:GDP-mannose transporter
MADEKRELLLRDILTEEGERGRNALEVGNLNVQDESLRDGRQPNPIPPVLSYCASSILMTVANKYIVSLPNYNLNFLLLAVQVCIATCSAI